MRTGLRRSRGVVGVAAFVAVFSLVGDVAGAASSRSTATIDVTFADACTDFRAQSSKDISHVELHYADGHVLKDEAITSTHYAVAGNDTIASVVVKSGTTSAEFPCQVAADSPPVAVLEAQNSAGEWTAGPENDAFCPQPFDVCYPGVFDPHTIVFRGVSSTDADGDITSWSIDFGDGTSTGTQDWVTSPPTSVPHAYFVSAVEDTQPLVTLTVTDSQGNTSTDSLQIGMDTDHED